MWAFPLSGQDTIQDVEMTVLHSCASICVKCAATVEPCLIVIQICMVFSGVMRHLARFLYFSR